MSRSKLLAAAITAAALGLAAPAAAEGSVSFRWTPQSKSETDALHAGLTLYSLIEGIEDGRITQVGRDNLARLAQRGPGHLGIIRQDGDGHRGELVQRGRNNAFALIQSGRATSARVVQSGRGGAGLLFRHGF